MITLNNQEFNNICRRHRSGGFWAGVILTLSSTIVAGAIVAFVWWLS